MSGIWKSIISSLIVWLDFFVFASDHVTLECSIREALIMINTWDNNFIENSDQKKFQQKMILVTDL